MNASLIVMPTTGAELQVFVDARIAEKAKVPAKLPMTLREKVVVVVLSVFIAVSVVLWVASFSAYRNEIDARLDGNCQTVIKVRTALENVLLAATAPRSEANAQDDPERLESIRTLNRNLAAARAKYLPPIRALRCD